MGGGIELDELNKLELEVRSETKYLECKNKCCFYKTKEYIGEKNLSFKHKYNKLKAGVVFHDVDTNKIMLVQSRGEKWGPPKGTIEENESLIECAIREVYEETMIQLQPSQLNEQQTIVINNATYFYLPFTSCDVQLNDSIEDTGIGWFHIDCLSHHNYFELNFQCKRILKQLSKIHL